MHLGKHLICALLSASLFSSFAVAQAPCKDDIDKLCAQHRGKLAQMRKCLVAHQEQLSPECKARVALKSKATKKRVAKKMKRRVRRACKADAQKFCQSETQNKRGVLKCLRSHRDELQPECKAQLGKARKARKKMRRAKRRAKRRAACREDVKTHCQGVKPGKGRIIACLKEKMSALSQPCQDQFKRGKPATAETEESAETPAEEPAEEPADEPAQGEEGEAESAEGAE